MESITQNNVLGVASGESSDLSRYLDVLFDDAGAGWVEVRWRRGEDQMGRRFLPVSDLSGVERLITRLGCRTDVYVGVLKRQWRRGDRDAIDSARVLWADCDEPEAARRLESFPIAPSMVVRSGSAHGHHAYWLLEEPIAPDIAEALNDRLASALSADPASTDPGRILRPPGTLNFKRERSARVALITASAARHSLDALDAELPALKPKPASKTVAHSCRGADALHRIAPAVYIQRLLGIEATAGHKVRCPLHDDRRPSLHVYPTAQRGWYCFGCRRGGDIYDLAGALWGLATHGAEFRELRARLLEAFGRG